VRGRPVRVRAIYAALAEELDALLLTTDQALLDALPERASATNPKV
jgi:predicted nucleic acid-binding protein